MSGRLLAALAVALLAAGPVAAQKVAPATTTTPGMVITGEKDGPRQIQLSPWRDPSIAPPETPLQARLPEVFDEARSIADEPANRRIPAGAVVSPPAPPEKRESAPPPKRVRGQRDAPTAIIMQNKNP